MSKGFSFFFPWRYFLIWWFCLISPLQFSIVFLCLSYSIRHTSSSVTLEIVTQGRHLGGIFPIVFLNRPTVCGLSAHVKIKFPDPISCFRASLLIKNQNYFPLLILFLCLNACTFRAVWIYDSSDITHEFLNKYITGSF